ncbi:hypothetical protein [Bacillus sp. 2205SS5-2]|uniref:hypothetical protein n=1 Tax=Bacillus sp. 2205SS5-2 TaxID=3109031 RepID=UPI003006CA61
MSRRGVGISFIAIASFLISSKYISAAIFGSSLQNWNEGLFNAMLEYVGNTLSNLSVIALIAGILYLFIAEFESIRNKKKEQYY